VGIFNKRRALDPLVVEPVTGVSGEEEQDNSAGRDDPSFEDLERAEATRKAQRGWLPYGGERL
jgi:hypothetical protein